MRTSKEIQSHYIQLKDVKKLKAEKRHQFYGSVGFSLHRARRKRMTYSGCRRDGGERTSCTVSCVKGQHVIGNTLLLCVASEDMRKEM